MKPTNKKERSQRISSQIECNEKLLINLVKPEEYLYNRYHPFYRNHTVKQSKWNDIAININSTPKDCKAKWKALRDQYAREMKRLTRTNKDDIVRWKHYSDLEFLKKYITTRVEISGCKVEKSYEQTSLDNSNENIDVKIADDQSQQDDAHWEFLDGTSTTDFTEQTFENSTMDHTTAQNQEQQQHDQQQQSQQQENNTAEIFLPHNQQDEEEDDSIHTFLKIEGFFEKQLISLVKSEECLYNRRHPHYRNYDIKNQKWEEIATKLKTTVKQARLKWKALRDQYTREFKRLKRKSLKHPIKIEDTSRWRHYDSLCYLEEFIRERKYKDGEDVSEEIVAVTCENPPETEMDLDYIIESEADALQDGNNDVFEDAQKQDILQSNELSPIRIQQLSTVKLEQLGNGNNGNIITTNDNGNGVGKITTSLQITPIAEEDEVDAFFKAISMKVRHARLSPVVFTDLQIEILRLINVKFRNFNELM